MDTSMQNFFKNLALFRDNDFMCDVTIEAEDTKFPVHKVVLAASSDYFKTLFSTDMKERNQNVIELKGISSIALEVCINSIYHSEVVEIMGNIEEVLHAACLFQMWGLKKKCFGIMQKKLTLQNSFQYFKLSQMYDAGEFQKTTLLYICKNFSALVQLGEFLDLSKEILETLIRSSELEIEREGEVFDAVNRWVSHDEYYRKQYFCAFFKMIRLTYVTDEYLIENVIYHPLVKNCETCSRYLKNWLLYESQKSKKIAKRSNRGGKNILILNENCTCISTYDIERSIPRELDIPFAGLKAELHCKLTLLIGSKLYATGSIDDDTMYWCDVVCETGWNRLPRMTVVHNTKVSGNEYISGTAAYKDHLLVIGGHDGENFLRIVEAFNLKTQQWRMLPNLICARESLAVAVLKDFVYAIGGYNGHGLNSVERFSFASNEWSNVTPLHGCRYDSTATTYGEKIYVIGGVIGNNFVEHCILKSVEMFSDLDNTWTIIRDLNFCRSNLGSCVLRNSLYVVGGSGDANSSLYEVLSSDGSKWEESGELSDEDVNFCKCYSF